MRYELHIVSDKEFSRSELDEYIALLQAFLGVDASLVKFKVSQTVGQQIQEPSDG